VARKPVQFDKAETIADGLATRSTYELTFPTLLEGLTDFVTVTDAEIADAMRMLLRTTHSMVEPAGAAKLTQALAACEPVTLDRTSSIADCLMAVRIGSLTFAHHQAYMHEVVTVYDGAIRDAVRFLLDRTKLVAEPSGAITLAALRTGAVTPSANTVCVLSGGNIEWDGLQELLGDA
jgi:threonine dehydratase